MFEWSKKSSTWVNIYEWYCYSISFMISSYIFFFLSFFLPFFFFFCFYSNAYRYANAQFIVTHCYALDVYISISFSVPMHHFLLYLFVIRQSWNYPTTTRLILIIIDIFLFLHKFFFRSNKKGIDGLLFSESIFLFLKI